MSNVLILEDHKETAARLHTIVETSFSEVSIFCAASIQAAAKACANSVYNVALIDINLPDGNGIDFIKILKQNSPECFSVVTTMFDEDDYIFAALRQGARGYILKEQSDLEIAQLLKGILNGIPPLSPGISRKILYYFESNGKRNQNHNLSERELEVLILVAKGYTRKEVARLMSITVNTVSAYIKSIYTKLSINNCSEATLEAVRLGLIKVD